MRVRRGGVRLLTLLLLTALATGGSAQSLDVQPRGSGDLPRRSGVGANGALADGAGIRLAVLSVPSVRESDRWDPPAATDPILRVEFRPPGSSAALGTASRQPADPVPGRRDRSVPESTSFILLAAGLVGVALSRRRFKR